MTKKPEMIEGPLAKDNFERAMKVVFRVSKDEIKAAEKRDREKRKRKKC